MIATRILFVAWLVCISGIAYADQTTVSFDSGSKAIYNENTALMIPLSGGTPANGDGTVLELGYFDGASIGNNFAGNWVALSGESSLNTAVIPGGLPFNPTGEKYNETSIGDLTANGASNATFAISLNFVLGNATSGNSMPASTAIPLALRFYDNTTIATSTYYNVVSDDLWLWKAPTPVGSNVTISLDDLNLEWLSIFQGQNASTEFHTTIPLAAVPEPATVATGFLAAASIIATALRRRRKIS